MRLALCALVGGLILGACLCESAAAEPGPAWWPFGRGTDEIGEPSVKPEAVASESGSAAMSQEPASAAETAEEEPGWMIDSPRAKVSWPRLQLPDFSASPLPRPWPHKEQSEAPRNAWAEDSPITPEQPSPMQALKDGARRVGDSTRAAWHKTIDVLTPGGTSPASSRVARRDTQPSWWKRMFKPEAENQGPQTISEWMAQDRLDP